MLKHNYIFDTILLLLIFLFAYAGSVKILDYSTFSIQLSKSPLIYNFAKTIALVLPVGEIIIAILLITERFRSRALYLSYFLMLTFTLYLIYILNFSYYIPCSCGGILGQLPWTLHIVFNLFFVVITLIGIFLNKKKPTPHEVH